MTDTHPHLALLAAHDLHRLMGLEIHQVDGARAHHSFVVTAAMLVPAGAVHAGLIYAACDFCAYDALMSELREGESAVTHDLHVSVMRSAGAGELVDIRAELVKRGRNVAFIDARASCGERLLASARITKSILTG